MVLEVALSLYIAWLVPTLLPIIGWKEGVRYSNYNNYNKGKGREPVITIGGREKGRERELEFSTIIIIRELEFPITIVREVEEVVIIIREAVEEARGIVKEREF